MRVILAAGGSGGHIFPSVALARELEKAGVKEIFFVSSKRRLDKNILKNTKRTSFFLSVNPMPLKFNPIRIIIFTIKLFADTIISLFLTIKLKPDVVVGFGGYSSGAIVGVASMLKVPVLIHEQNLVPGKANRILSRIVDCVAVSFKESAGHFASSKGKIIYSGNPLRLDMLSNDRAESARRLGLSPKKLTVLIMGGSQGSSFLNRVTSEVAQYITGQKGDIFQFIHLTGKKDYEYVKQFYEKNRICNKVFSFLERIDDAYAISDLAISRSGAASIFELAFYAKPMILVPYPNPKNNQRFNAIYFSRIGAAIHKEEDDLSGTSLAKEVLGILANDEKRNHMAKIAGKLSVPEAGQVLAKEVMRLAGRCHSCGSRNL